MNHRLLILGSKGQIGSELKNLLHSTEHIYAGDITMPTSGQLNLCQADAIVQTVRTFKPHVLINAAAYTNVEQAENNSDTCYAINAHASGILAEECKRLGSLLIHYSSDYVFDGTQNTPYTETSKPNPISVYGHSKLLGDQYIQETDGDYVILRTSWVFSPKGDNFYKKILALGRQRGELSIVDDQIGAPTAAQFLAELALNWNQKRKTAKDCPTGLFNATAAGQTSWYDYAALSFEICKGTALLPKVPVLNRATTQDMKFKAARPAYSVLNTKKLQNTLGICPPHWQDAVTAALLTEIQNLKIPTQKDTST